MNPGAMGAIAAARRNPREPRWHRDYVTPRHDVGQVRLDHIDREMAERHKMAKIMRKYDTDGSGKLNREQVKKLLTDADVTTPKGTPPSDEELDFIMKCADKHSDGLDMQEAKYALCQWKIYIKLRPELCEAMKKYDASNSGQLEREELKEWLTSLNGGKPVTDSEVDYVMAKADVFRTGALSQQEMLYGVAAWYGLVEEQQKDKCCAVQ